MPYKRTDRFDEDRASEGRDKALKMVMERGGKKQSHTELGKRLRPIYKSVERHLTREVKKGGHQAKKELRNKNGYMNHLTERAHRRGEED